MVQRLIFPQTTQISNVGDPNSTDLTGAVTVNYLNNSINTSAGLLLDTPEVWANASVPSGNIILATGIPAGTPSQMVVQTTGVAGTETAIKQFIDNYGTTETFRFVGFTDQLFTVNSTVANSGTVTLNLGITPTFATAVPSGTVLQLQTAPATYTRFRDIVLGTNLTGTIANNIQARPTLTLNATGSGTSGSAINLGSTFVGDNVGSLVRVLSSDPTLTNVAGSLAAVSDFGSINISSAWPPSTGNANSYFVVIEASDFSWSGIGAIQTTPTNGIIQIAWIRRPSVPSGTTFTNGRLWVTTNATASQWVTTSTGDIANVNPTTSLVWPDLALGAITTASDGFGSNASVIRLQPTIDARISSLIGSVGTITQWPSTVSPPVAAVTATTIVVDDEVLGPQLVGQYLWVNAQANQPNTVLVTAGVQTGQQYTLTVTGNPQSAGFSITTQNIWYSSSATPNLFVFQPPPRNAVIALAQQNTVPSLNGLQGNPVTITAGSGIAVATTAPGTIQITNTSSGVSSSNFTTFINDLGQSLGTAGYVSFVSSSDNTAWVGLGMDSDVASNDGGLIGNQRVLGTTQGTAVSTYGYAALFPFAATYTDLQVEIFVPAMVITFTSTFSSGWDIELYFSRADSTAANDPGRNANLFPAFRSGPSDLVSLNILRASQVVFAPVSGQANTYTCTVSGGGLYSAVANNYQHSDTVNGYLAWVRIDGPAITGITSVVINQSNSNNGNSGGYRALAALPGVGGATPTLDQVLTVGNTSTRSLSLTGTTAVLATPTLALNNTSANTILLRTPMTIPSSYAITLPAASPNYGTTLITTDAAGNTAWQPAGLELIRLISTVNVTPSGAQTVDGVSVLLNDLVLLQNQTATAEDGLYAVVLSGAWMRITTYPSQSVFATAGTANINRTYTRNQTASPEQWVLTGSASGGGGTPGGTNLSYQWNNSGTFAGDGALFRDTTNNRVSALAPIDQANVARYGDVLQAATGISPSDPMGIPVNIAEVNVSGVYTNNSGAGSATLTGTGILTVAGVIPNPGDIVLLVNQTQQIQNGGYTVNNANYSLQIVFATPACFPQVATTVTFSFTNIAGGSANFTMSFNASQLLSNAAATRPAGLDSSWGYTFTGGNTVTLTSTLTSVRWTTAPVLTVDVVPGVTWQMGIPTSRTFNPLAPFLITRLPSPITYGELWVADALASNNYGVQFFNTTIGTITIGTTPITFALFGVASPVNTLQRVTANGNTTNLGIGFQQTSGGTNAITLVGSQFLTASRQFQLQLSNYPLVSGTPLVVDQSGNIMLASSINIGNSATDNLTLSPGIIQRTAPGTLTLLAGTGANDAILLGSGGTGNVNFLRIASATTGVGPTISVTGEAAAPLNIAAGSTGQVNIATNRGNNVAIIGGALGTGPVIAARGGDTNLSLDVRGAGTGSINLGSNQANFVNITPGAAGASPVIAANGSDANISLTLRGRGTGGVVLGAGGQPVSLGPVVTSTYITPFMAANSLVPFGNLVAGTSGQVLTSRGTGATPCWTTPTAASANVYAYALLNDQSVGGGSAFSFNTTATIAVGAAFGSFTSASTFTFTQTGAYQVSFSYNLTGGGIDLSIQVPGNTRVVGATSGGKGSMIGIGNVTASGQTLQVVNFSTGTFSAGQSSIVIIRLG